MPSRRASLAVLLALLVSIPVALGARQRADSIPVTGDRLSGFVLPVEPLAADIRLEALRAWAWEVDDTRRLLLEGDVRIDFGGRTFAAASAVIWINRIPSADGLINQVAVYFDEVADPARRAGMGAEGRDLLLTGSARGEITLSVAGLERQRPRASGLVQRGEARLAEHLRRLLALPPPLAQEPVVDQPPDRRAFTPVPGGMVRPQDVELPERVELPAFQETLPLLPPRGMVRWSAGAIELRSGAEENTLLASGGVVLEYVSAQREEFERITIAAERAVIFTEPGPLEGFAAGELSMETVHGVYLEGDVSISVDDGDYFVRAPRVYYDFRSQQAIMVDAVLRTYTRLTQAPIYARAREMRQLAANQWQAGDVVISTSEFAVPHIALGAERTTITRRPVVADPEQRETYIESEQNSLLLGGTPLLGWPRFAGTTDDVPLRRLSVGSGSRHDGVAIETTWDLYALSGRRAPDGVEADLRADVYTARGAGAGLELRYDVADAVGTLDLYGLWDSGEDRTSSGRDVEQDDGLRGVALWEHQVRLGRDWTMQAQTSYISDETYITTWREDDFEKRREYETSLYVKQQHHGSAFTALVQYELNDFISNSSLLASRGFQVDKVPELTYRRYGDGWFDGALSYSGETRLTRMRLVFERHTPNELGVPAAAFGIGATVPVSDVLRGAGLSTTWVNRFDSRHELSMPGQIGAVDVTPFIVGRLTAWDDDFESFSSDAESNRLFGAAGIRLNTTLQRVDNTAHSRLFDINRLRHIIEPSVTLWYGYAGVDQEDLPPYDPEVESLADGAAVQLGLRNTWQTQRGGPGRWHSVDVFTLDTALLFTSSDVDREAPTPRFFEYRPEYSPLGDHLRTAFLWLLSDALSLAGEQTYDLNESAVARGSVGVELRHTPVLTTFAELRYLDAPDETLLGVGWIYQLTPRYELLLRPQWDFREEDFRALTFRLTRRFPDFELSLEVRHDEIRDETSVGASMDLAEF